MSSIKQIELLAPAKNLETGIAAINSGADAVYIAANKFGARHAAGNSVQDIEKLIHYAHLFNVKVYVTINTILYNNELSEAENLIHELYIAGADAIIIQDMGILEMNLPPIPIFASTQTHNIDWRQVEFFEKLGIRRVILARELSLSQITEIRNKTSIELEFFIHGALCVCYSGQCYMSSAFGGRSANRGECAQPCRLEYDLEDSNGKVIVKNKHLLSLKDLNLTDYIPDLIDAGISSFKIEGRLKDVEYVKNVVLHYRRKIDEALHNRNLRKQSSGIVQTDFVPDPEKTFNRRSSSYFLKGRGEKIEAFETPKSLGKPIGEVKVIGKDFFTLNSETILTPGDGICCICSDGKLRGTSIYKSIGGKFFPEDTSIFSAGITVYRNFDKHFSKEIIQADFKRKIVTDIVVSELNDGFLFNAIDEDLISVEHKVITEKINSENPELATSIIINQLRKSGESVFHIRHIDVNFSNKYFFRTSELNNVRRELLNKLQKKREDSYVRLSVKIIPNDYPYFSKALGYNANVSNELAERFYRRHGVEVVEYSPEVKGHAADNALMVMKHCVKYSIGHCPVFHKQKQSEYIEPYYLVQNGKKLKLEFNCKSCEVKIFN